MELLKRLSEAPGVPGREERIRAIIRAEVEDYCDSIDEDAMGNLICFRAASTRPAGEPTDRVMVACHMDEIGFYVRNIDKNGFIRLQQLGGFDVRNLFARKVLIQGREDIYGVMNPAGRPIHIATEEDKKKLPRIIDFVVDTGRTAEEVESLVRPGDPVSLVQECIQIGDLVTGKALDNRVACWTGVRLLQELKSSASDLYVVFTVQEEIGLRGAFTSAFGIEPDYGIAIDTTLAVDTPGIPDEEQVTAIGAGAGIKVMDSRSVSDHQLVDRFVELAKHGEIPHQLEILPLGGTDAGAVQKARLGCKVITLSVPTRYIHTVTETIDKSDLNAVLSLLKAFIVQGPGNNLGGSNH